VGRIRELLAHGGIAVLAGLFALAFAMFGVAQSVAFAVVYAAQQHLVDETSGGSGFDFRIAGTDFDLYAIVQAALTLVVVVALLLLAWKVTRRASRECPACRSDVPAGATICRYCTTDLPEIAAP
jgi:hypothetical protein